MRSIPLSRAMCWPRKGIADTLCVGSSCIHTAGSQGQMQGTSEQSTAPNQCRTKLIVAGLLTLTSLGLLACSVFQFARHEGDQIRVDVADFNATRVRQSKIRQIKRLARRIEASGASFELTKGDPYSHLNMTDAPVSVLEDVSELAVLVNSVYHDTPAFCIEVGPTFSDADIERIASVPHVTRIVISSESISEDGFERLRGSVSGHVTIDRGTQNTAVRGLLGVVEEELTAPE